MKRWKKVVIFCVVMLAVVISVYIFLNGTGDTVAGTVSAFETNIAGLIILLVVIIILAIVYSILKYRLEWFSIKGIGDMGKKDRIYSIPECGEMALRPLEHEGKPVRYWNQKGGVFDVNNPPYYIYDWDSDLPAADVCLATFLITNITMTEIKGFLRTENMENKMNRFIFITVDRRTREVVSKMSCWRTWQEVIQHNKEKTLRNIPLKERIGKTEKLMDYVLEGFGRKAGEDIMSSKTTGKEGENGKAGKD